MAPGHERVLIGVVLTTLLTVTSGASQKFFPDDPIEAAPPPLPVTAPLVRDVNQIYDFLHNSRRPERRPGPPAGATNTLGNVPDSPWFTNRHGRRPMTREELQRGPGDSAAPTPPFTVIGGKEGVQPGFRIMDSEGRTYYIKMDPVKYPEMATAAEVIVSKFLYAIGYNTPENYIVEANLSDFTVARDAMLDSRRMTWGDFCLLLNKTQTSAGKFRLAASLEIPGKSLGPFRFEGTRTDDPNDTVNHEDRRDLRGLFVFAGWLNHTDVKANNTLDVLVQDNGVPHIRHYLIDFSSALGSDGTWPKDARFGHEFVLPTPSEVLRKILGLGLFPTEWEKAKFPDITAVGNFEAAGFDPDNWKSNYPNPAFLSRLPDDEFWGAKTVMTFSDDDIRAIAETGQYSDPDVVDYLTRTLAARRDRIGRTYFAKVLPLDNFRVEGGELQFDDLAFKYGLAPAQQYTPGWFYLDNATGQRTPLLDGAAFELPKQILDAAPGAYFSAIIHRSDDVQKSVAVDLRKTATGVEVVGIERTW